MPNRLRAASGLSKSGFTKSKAPIPGAIGMRAKLAFVTLISKGGEYATGQQGENRVATDFRWSENRPANLSPR